MLSHVEVTARVTVTPAAHFVWSSRLEYAHDCFVCEQTGGKVLLHHGATHGTCSLTGHRAPIRVTGFDAADQGSARQLRCRLSFWWSPFGEASELSAAPWVLLGYRVGCHTCRDAGEDDWLGIQNSVQSDQVWPVTSSCPRCDTELVTMSGPPEINLVG